MSILIGDMASSTLLKIIAASHWLSASSPKVYDDFMPMEDLQKRDNVFVKNDVLIVEVQFLVISAVKA